jgi:nicotinate-nucleotide adenylyltransferase
VIELKKNTTVLYFGTYNPVHIGHMIIGQYIFEHSNAKELWYVVSPQNPFKENQQLLSDRQRLHMVNLAIKDPYHIKTSDIEFGLPKPSYTAVTLAHLSEKYPEKNFAIVMGSDNLVNFHKWRNYQAILDHHQIIVYPRKDKDTDAYDEYKNVHRIKAPEIELSSTLIRKSIKQGVSVSQMLPQGVWEYIDKNGFYLH